MSVIYGDAGRFMIPEHGVNVPLYDKGKRKLAQDVVDREDSALLSKQYACHYIADHAAQGFDRIKKCGLDDYAVIQTPSSTQFYYCVAVTLGTNTSKGLVTSGGAKVAECKWADLCCYCCTDATGKNIAMVFFKKGLHLNYPLYRLEESMYSEPLIDNTEDEFESEDCPELEEAVYISSSNGMTSLEIPDDMEDFNA